MNTELLAKAIKDGKAYHLFDKATGTYTGQSFFYSHTAEVIPVFHPDLEVRFLTNIPITHGGKS